MTPVVSVCIPTYNRKDFLKEALASVFAQTFGDYEVVVVDDGSTDGTEEMIKNDWPAVRFLRQPNSGDAAARNRLLELAQGEFIVYLDSDDLLIPDALERMAAVMKNEHSQVVVYGPYIRIDHNGNYCGKDKRKLYSGFITKHLFDDIIVHPNGSMWPAKLLRDEGSFDETLSVCSDYYLWLRLSLKVRFIALPEPTFKHRRHGDNLSKPSYKNKLTELAVLRRFHDELPDKSIIPDALVRRRFSIEEYRVGLSAMREHNPKLASVHFRRSFSEKPNVKSLLMRMLLTLKR